MVLRVFSSSYNCNYCNQSITTTTLLQPAPACSSLLLSDLLSFSLMPNITLHCCTSPTNSLNLILFNIFNKLGSNLILSLSSLLNKFQTKRISVFRNQFNCVFAFKVNEKKFSLTQLQLHTFDLIFAHK